MDSQYDIFKHEDIDTTSPATEYIIPDATPAPVVVYSKPAKKRKSWGQKLPEPTTALPPRKRAKTEDEREQRRIERIKRNRAAAHNSRERKRQETDTLAVQLARANAELDAYRNLHGPLPASVILPEVTLSIDDGSGTPAPSLDESRASVDLTTSPFTPQDDLFDSDITLKQEPTDLTYPTTFPPSFTDLSQKPSTLAQIDQTRHSAVSVDQPQPDDFNFNSFSFPMGPSLLLPYDASAPDYLQDDSYGNLDAFPFTDGAYDASLNPALDLSFNEFVNDSAIIADGFGTSAA